MRDSFGYSQRENELQGRKVPKAAGSCNVSEFKQEEEEAENVPAAQPTTDNNNVDSGPSAGAKYALWQWSAIVSVTVTFSIIGVASSIIFRRRDIHQYVDLKSFSDVFVMFFLSVVCGLLLLCLLVGGYLKGGIFPEFRSSTERFGLNSWIQTEFRLDGWGKLAVWAYISGFYERFISGVFDRLLKVGESTRVQGETTPHNT